MSDCRRPPIPDWPPVDGRKPCRWCGEAVRNADGTLARRTWHPACVQSYLIAVNSADQVRALWRRDAGECVACGWRPVIRVGRGRSVENDELLELEGYDGPVCLVYFRNLGGWEADHRVPLWSIDRCLPWAEIKWAWSLDNLQTLCVACHRAKTKREAASRAFLARAQLQPDLFGLAA